MVLTGGAAAVPERGAVMGVAAATDEPPGWFQSRRQLGAAGATRAGYTRGDYQTSACRTGRAIYRLVPGGDMPPLRWAGQIWPLGWEPGRRRAGLARMFGLGLAGPLAAMIGDGRTRPRRGPDGSRPGLDTPRWAWLECGGRLGTTNPPLAGIVANRFKTRRSDGLATVRSGSRSRTRNSVPTT